MQAFFKGLNRFRPLVQTPWKPSTRFELPLPIQYLRMSSHASFKKLKKPELHYHFDGSMRPLTIWELAKDQEVDLGKHGIETLEQLVNAVVNDDTVESLEEFLLAYQITTKVLQTPAALRRAFREQCEDAVRDGISYLEIRFAPILHTEKGLTIDQVLDEMTQAALEIDRADLPIHTRLIVCGLRHLDPSTSVEQAKAAVKYANLTKMVVGFDLAGPEAGFPASRHAEALKIAAAGGLGITIHSGEGDGPHSVKDALDHGAHRIGHGTRLIEESSLVAHVRERNIPIEINVTSNSLTKACRHKHEHPVRKYFDQGLRIVVCTDSTTVNGIDLSHEYHLLHHLHGFKPHEFDQIIKQGFEASFAPPELKQRLIQEAKQHNADVWAADFGGMAEQGGSFPQALAEPQKN